MSFPRVGASSKHTYRGQCFIVLAPRSGSFVPFEESYISFAQYIVFQSSAEKVGGKSSMECI